MLPESKTEQFLKAIQSTIKSELDDFKTVELHGGRFSVRDLQRLGAKSPACFITWTTVKTPKSPLCAEERVISITCAISTTDSSDVSRYLLSIRLSENLQKLVKNNGWGIRNASSPKEIVTSNLYSIDIDKTGAALCAVSWHQMIQI